MAVAAWNDGWPRRLGGGLILLLGFVAPVAAQAPAVAAAVPPTAAPSAAVSAETAADGQRAYDAGDFTRAHTIWSSLAAQGDNAAAMGLAALLDQGEGVARDQVAALHWYTVAAEHGLPQAEFDAGIMLDSGRGAARDVAQAAIWYARAASHGQRRAQYNLGQLYAGGEGVPRNPDVARAWYRLAATNGVSAAAGKLASPRVAPLLPPHLTAAPELSGVMLQAPAREQEVAALPPNGNVEFVWAAPPQPVPVTFFIEVEALTGHGTRPAASRYVAETAVALDLGVTGGDYVWRIYVVDQRRQRYSIGDWQRFSIKAPQNPAG